jgi:hypothetical protein
MKKCPVCNIEKEDAEFVYGKRILIRCLPCQNKQRCEKRKVIKENAKETTKTCKVCNTEKNGAEFELGTLYCKLCFSEKEKEANHRPTETDPDKTCITCNTTKSATMFRKRELVCKECSTQKLYEWRENNKERFLEICKTYREKENKKALRNQNRKKKYAEDIKFKLVQLYRTRVRLCIKKKFYPVNTAFDYAGLLGCEWQTLIQWLEFNMKPGMTWENYGPYWHVDHVYPCALFDFSKETDRIKCFNWTNLTPLESIENLKKSDHLDIDLIQHYRKRAIEFIQQVPNIEILTDSLPDDVQLLVKSGALTTKDDVKALSGSEEKSEVR